MHIQENKSHFSRSTITVIPEGEEEGTKSYTSPDIPFNTVVIISIANMVDVEFCPFTIEKIRSSR